MRFYRGSLAQAQSQASNIRAAKNPPYTIDNLLEFYPQFKDQVNDTIVNNFIDIANSMINVARYHSQWKWLMSLYIAHLLTLHILTSGTVENPSQNIMQGLSKGVTASKSVDGVSISYDNALIQDFKRYGDLCLTTFGIQLASRLLNPLSYGGMYVS